MIVEAVTAIGTNKVQQLMSDEFIVLDHEYKIINVSSTLCITLNLDCAQLTQKPVRVLANKLPDILAPLQSYQSSGIPRPFEVSFSVGDDMRYFKVQLAPLKIPGTTFAGHLLTLREVTEDRHAQQRIQAQLELLAVRAGELDAFNHTVAHELRAPLSLIAGYANLLLDMDAEDLPPTVEEYVTQIQNTALKMSDMIDALLIFAKYQDSVETITSVVNIEAIVRSAIARFRPQIDRRGITIIIEPNLPGAVAYDLWLEEVFANLVGNAIKYIGSDNPDPRIIIRGIDEGDYILYEVEDNGLGMEDEELDRIFRVFGRIEKDGAVGTGLGLSIVRRIIRRFGGEVGVKSEAGGGSIFWFTLPSGR